MNEDYEVGYKKPPKEHRFRKGRSGNPRGRPTNQKQLKPETSLAEIVKRVGEKTLPIGGEERSLDEMAITALYKKAVEGNVPAMRALSALRKDLGLLKPDMTQRCGVLVVPAPMDEPDFEKLAFKQQAKFRENQDDEEGDD